MKRVIVDFRGMVCDVVDIGKEFEIYDGPDATLKWVICPHDEVDPNWALMKGEWISPEMKLDTDQNTKRRVAYGSVEEQLGMIYDDLIAGNLNEGQWITHVQNIKAAIPSKAQWEADESNWKGKITLEYHTIDDPCWNYLSPEFLIPPTFGTPNVQ